MTCDFLGQACKMVLNYVPPNNAETYSLLYSTTNGGTQWSFLTTALTSAEFPKPINQSPTKANLRFSAGITCDRATGMQCIAAGSYLNTSGGTYPVIYTTSNGTSWAAQYFGANGSSLNLPSDAVTVGATANIRINGGVACDIYTGMLCNAVGQYLSVSGSTLPLSYWSNNGGLSWTLVNPTPLPNGAINSKLNSVS